MTSPNRYRVGRTSVIGLAAGLIGLVLVANAHFLYVARSSDPGCVEHRVAPGGDGSMLRAARSDC